MTTHNYHVARTIRVWKLYLLIFLVVNE